MNVGNQSLGYCKTCERACIGLGDSTHRLANSMDEEVWTINVVAYSSGSMRSQYLEKNRVNLVKLAANDTLTKLSVYRNRSPQFLQKESQKEPIALR